MQQLSRGAGFSLAIIALTAAGVALIALKSILLPFIVAFFLAELAGPSVTYIKKKGLPTGPAILVIILLTAAAIFLVGKIFYSQVPGFLEEFPSYRQRILDAVDSIAAALPSSVTELVSADWSQILPGKEVAQAVAGTIGTLFSLLGTFLLILLYMVFLLLERESFLFRVKKAWPGEKGSRLISIVDNIQKQTENYITGKTLTSLLTAALVTLFLSIMQVKFFFIWGLLTFLLNYIPNIGSFIATILPVMMAAVQIDPVFSPVKTAVLAAALITIQFAVGSILEPKLLGDRLRLSPLVVFLSFILWGWIWGVPGMILSVPIAALLKIVFENVETLKPAAILISSDKPKPEKPN